MRILAKFNGLNLGFTYVFISNLYGFSIKFAYFVSQITENKADLMNTIALGEKWTNMTP